MRWAGVCTSESRGGRRGEEAEGGKGSGQEGICRHTPAPRPPEELLWPSQVTVAGVCEECHCRALHVLRETLSHLLPGYNKSSFCLVLSSLLTDNVFSVLVTKRPKQIHISVNSHYLFMLFFPHADEYKSKVVCEEERMRLSCKRGMQIAVYSAMFGRTQQGTLECPLHHTRAPSVGESPCHFQCEPGLFIRV